MIPLVLFPSLSSGRPIFGSPPPPPFFKVSSTIQNPPPFRSGLDRFISDFSPQEAFSGSPPSLVFFRSPYPFLFPSSFFKPKRVFRGRFDLSLQSFLPLWTFFFFFPFPSNLGIAFTVDYTPCGLLDPPISTQPPSLHRGSS